MHISKARTLTAHRQLSAWLFTLSTCPSIECMHRHVHTEHIYALAHTQLHTHIHTCTHTPCRQACSTPKHTVNSHPFERLYIHFEHTHSAHSPQHTHIPPERTQPTHFRLHTTFQHTALTQQRARAALTHTVTYTAHTASPYTEPTDILGQIHTGSFSCLSLH